MKLITYSTKDGKKAGLLLDNLCIKLAPALKEYFFTARGVDAKVKDDMAGLIGEGLLSAQNLKGLSKWLAEAGRARKFAEKEIPHPEAPLIPGKIIALGRNFKAHAKEQNAPAPKEPIIFEKASSSVIGHFGEVVYAGFIKKECGKTARVDHEVELAVVIGKTAKNVKAKSALDYVFGYTVINDVTARSIQERDFKLNQPWFRSKSLDTFCPMGPWIVTKDEVGNPHNLKLSCKVNGQVKQSGSTKDFIFRIPEVIEYITKYLTLFPGDVISTGTVDGISPVKPGDVMTCEVEKVGILVNKVVKGLH